MSDVITGNSKVTLHFALKLEDGSVVDSTFEKDPATLSVGDGNLPASFETLLLGLHVGAKEEFTVPPEKAFGMPNPSNMQTIPRDKFDPEVELQKGLMLSFSDAANTELPGVIAEFDEQNVVVDFNHPLAGHTLRFEVEIVAVEPAATEH